MDETHKQILRRARQIIEKPEAWAQGMYAVDAEGERASINARDACRFCAKGALYKAADEFESCDPQIGMSFKKAEVSLVVAMGEPVTAYNDRHTHNEVMAAFDAAIQNS